MNDSSVLTGVLTMAAGVALAGGSLGQPGVIEAFNSSAPAAAERSNLSQPLTRGSVLGGSVPSLPASWQAGVGRRPDAMPTPVGRPLPTGSGVSGLPDLVGQSPGAVPAPGALVVVGASAVFSSRRRR